MHKLLIIIFYLIGLSYNSNAQEAKDVIRVNVEVIGLKDKFVDSVRNFYKSYYFTRIDIHNTQDSIVHISMMDCSWNSSFLTDNDSIYIYHWSCDMQGVNTISLSPKQSLILYCLLAAPN